MGEEKEKPVRKKREEKKVDLQSIMNFLNERAEKPEEKEVKAAINELKLNSEFLPVEKIEKEVQELSKAEIISTCKIAATIVSTMEDYLYIKGDEDPTANLDVAINSLIVSLVVLMIQNQEKIDGDLVDVNKVIASKFNAMPMNELKDLSGEKLYKKIAGL